MPIYKTGKTKNGKAQYRVIVNYTDADGKYRKISRSVYGNAEAKMEELRMLAEVDGIEAPCAITVQLLYEKMQKAKQNELRQTSRDKTDSYMRNHILPYLGSVRLDELTPERLQEWKNTLAAKDMKVSTKNNAYKELRALFNFGVTIDYLAKNPLDKIGRFRDAYFTHEQDTLQ